MDAAIVGHKIPGEHNCAAWKCPNHRCTPLASSSIRQIHAVISGALTAAVRWGWIPYNPVVTVKLPAKRRQQPKPPSASQMAAIMEEVWRRDVEFGLFLWLSAVTGARRGEVLATRFNQYDLDDKTEVWFADNWVWTSDGLVLKETKTHQQRRVSLDAVTVGLLRVHQAERVAQLAALGLSMTGREFVFSAEPDLSRPRDPSSMTRRFGRIVGNSGLTRSSSSCGTIRLPSC